jgi:hypothetical protein
MKPNHAEDIVTAVEVIERHSPPTASHSNPGATAAILYALPQTCMGDATGWHAGLLSVQLLPMAIGYLLNRLKAWRNSFSAIAIALATTTAITFISLAGIHLVYRLEILSLIAGVALLIAGHVGLIREERATEESQRGDPENAPAHSESVTASLIFGSLLLAVPMIIGVVAFRIFGIDSADGWKIFHNVGGLVLGLSMLGTGILCRIRSTTLAGTAVMGSYLVTLLLLIRLPEELQSISVMMMIGGGTFFGVAILLSLYRDWLLGLPTRVREGRGVFKVMNWR